MAVVSAPVSHVRWLRGCLAAAAIGGLLALGVVTAGAELPAEREAAVGEYASTPDKLGGRSVSVSISSDPMIAIEAAEGGGLYRTADGGVSWTPIHTLPMFRMEDVSYDPSNANIVIATTRYDGRVNSRAGVWRSADGGTTWARALVAYACTTTPHAWGIGMVAGRDAHRKIFVATDCGVAYSNDSGATWASIDPTGGSGTGFFDVTAIRIGVDTVRAYACGPAGVYRTTVSGSATPVWTAASTGYPTRVNDRCQLATSPRNTHTVLLTNPNCPQPPGDCTNRFGMRLFESDDSGATWTDLNAPLANNRPGFVVTGRPVDGDATHFELYWGNGFLAFRQHCIVDSDAATLDCRVAPDTNCADAVDDDGDQIVNEGCPAVGPPEDSGSVPSQCKNALDDDGDGFVNDGCEVMERFDNGTHVDPSRVADIELHAGCPRLISNDGGIGRSTNCGLSWTDSNAGRRALQIYNVFGTVRGPGPTETDIYFGTQDNDWWFTLDNGGTWTDAGCCEGFLGQVDHRVPADGLDAIRIVYVNAAPPLNSTSGRGFLPFDYGNWPNPPGGGGNPIMFGNQRYGQISSDLGSPPSFRLYIMQPETGAHCDNGVDDDLDTGFNNAGAGAVNDGCPAVAAPETGAQCHNAVDDDGDGTVNDGCSSIFSVEDGAECTNAADDDGDGVVNDGCAPVPPDGSSRETGAQCLNAVDDDGDSTVNDGCPRVGVWGPMGPTFTEQYANALVVSGPVATPTFYFSVDVGGATFRLRKIAGPTNTTATLSNASGPGAPGTSLGDIGSYCGAEGTWYCPLVVAVDPVNPDRLYAADDSSREMKFTTDGGATWQPDPTLTALVTNEGEFRWSNENGSEAWTIAYDPENPQKILVGTELAGIIASVNGGTDWFRLAGTLNRVPFVTGFFFGEDHNLVYASSYGRGLWTLSP